MGFAPKDRTSAPLHQIERLGFAAPGAQSYVQEVAGHEGYAGYAGCAGCNDVTVIACVGSVGYTTAVVRPSIAYRAACYPCFSRILQIRRSHQLHLGFLPDLRNTTQ